MTDPTRPPADTHLAQAGHRQISIAEAIQQIASWTDLPIPRQRTTIAALRFLARVYGRPVEAVLLDPQEVTRQLDTVSCVRLGIRPGSLNQYRVCVTAILRRLGLIRDMRRETSALSPAWASLRDGLPDQFLSVRLQHFIAWCDGNGIAPADVSTQTVMSYRRDIEGNRIKGDPGDHARRVAVAWNKAGTLVAGWPITRLSVPSTVERYGTPASAFPASLNEEIEQMFDRWAGHGEGGLYSTPGVRPRRDTTIKTHRATLRAALNGAVQAGMLPAEIRSLSDIVNRAAVERILTWHWERADRKTTDFTGQIGGLLALIAKSHLGLVGAALKEITDATRAAKPKKRTQITLTNEERLAQFDDPVVLAQTLHLPEHLMKVAADLKAEGQALQAAWLASVAVAVKIELHCPLRIHTLNGLRLGKEVVKLGTSKQRYTHLLIGENRTKTDALVRWPLNASTSVLLDDFVTNHRAALGGAASPYLFAARNHTDKPRDKSAMGTAITRAIKEHIGITVNIHLFRAFAGVLILESNAASIEDLRQVLGHKTMETAMQYYTSHQSQRSALRLNDRVTALVKQTRSTAVAAFSGVKGKAAKPVRGSRQ